VGPAARHDRQMGGNVGYHVFIPCHGCRARKALEIA
jgi:hypothetical protein